MSILLDTGSPKTESDFLFQFISVIIKSLHSENEAQNVNNERTYGVQIQENKEGLNHTKTKAGSNQQQNIVCIKILLKHLYLFNDF